MAKSFWDEFFESMRRQEGQIPTMCKAELDVFVRQVQNEFGINLLSLIEALSGCRDFYVSLTSNSSTGFHLHLRDMIAKEFVEAEIEKPSGSLKFKVPRYNLKESGG